MRRSQVVAAVISCVSCCALAQPPSTITGRVVGVADGDTLTVLDGQNKQHHIRLSEIDAPEVQHGRNRPSQPFGERSKQSLAEICFGKQAKVLLDGSEDRGREIGEVFCGGQSANLLQVKRGMAWAYKRYAKSKAILAAEQVAEQGSIGLWRDQAPVAPWDWRHKVWQ